MIVLRLLLYFLFLSLVQLNGYSEAPRQQVVDSLALRERILFIHSYPFGDRGRQLNQGFEAVVRRAFPSTVFSFLHLDYDDLLPVFANFSWDNFNKHKDLVTKHRRALHEKIAEFAPTILVLSDDEVAEVIHPLPQDLKIPIFFMGMNRELADIPWYQKNPQQYVGGIEDQKPIAASIRVLREILPVKKIALVTSNEMSSHLILQSVLPQFAEFSRQEAMRGGPNSGLQVVKVIRSSSFAEWQKELREVQSKVDLVWMLVPYNVYDESGKEVKLSRIGEWMVENLKVPTVGISDVNVKLGALFAQASCSRRLGEQLGEQVQGFLFAKKLRSIGFERRLSYDYFVNKTTADRFQIQIPEERLPLLNVMFGNRVVEKAGTQ